MNVSAPDRIPLIRARNLRHEYPPIDRRGAPVAVLRGVDVDLRAGEMLAIVGPSGSGKSTLLHCLAGLEPLSEQSEGAELRVCGVPLLVPSSGGARAAGRGRVARLRRDRLGFVFQSLNLIPSLSVRENVALPARLARRGRPDVERALAEVGLEGNGGKRPGQLSGGQQQRVAIARVLAAAPAVVFADEPTGSLDTITGARVLDLLRAYPDAGRGRAVVLVTHDLDAASRADRVLVLRDGAVLVELERPEPARILAALEGATHEGAEGAEHERRPAAPGARDAAMAEGGAR
ncbi:ABC transporter ATP-binding protein [Gulosibacter sp. 10]|uniref:ABC transporter ATP-binding protein n=1 Tax=Gulosibacter sp. 10 TaxID=1255570 RepID=UPI00097F36EE|nr:ABC transporter ATP-binding protein [Gulosibacter sp. 10]SJM66221.1 ABC transporter [Gulosibacter sp. 10]